MSSFGSGPIMASIHCSCLFLTYLTDSTKDNLFCSIGSIVRRGPEVMNIRCLPLLRLLAMVSHHSRTSCARLRHVLYHSSTIRHIYYVWWWPVTTVTGVGEPKSDWDITQILHRNSRQEVLSTTTPHYECLTRIWISSIGCWVLWWCDQTHQQKREYQILFIWEWSWTNQLTI